jgi:hypothetical protein
VNQNRESRISNIGSGGTTRKRDGTDQESAWKMDTMFPHKETCTKKNRVGGGKQSSLSRVGNRSRPGRHYDRNRSQGGKLAVLRVNATSVNRERNTRSLKSDGGKTKMRSKSRCVKQNRSLAKLGVTRVGTLAAAYLPGKTLAASMA